jgi:hypothetical protein
MIFVDHLEDASRRVEPKLPLILKDQYRVKRSCPYLTLGVLISRSNPVGEIPELRRGAVS